jgi:hypothetical protein
MQACFDLLARQRTTNGAPIAPSTVDRIRATLRSALNAAVREGLNATNPLAQVRLARPVRPHPVIWTDERVAAWRRDGIRPAGRGVDAAAAHHVPGRGGGRPAFRTVVADRAARAAGEAAAQYLDDLGGEARELTICRQHVALPGELYCGRPKSRASIRTVALDEACTRRLVQQASSRTSSCCQT